jgi:hypothetical protein
MPPDQTRLRNAMGCAGVFTQPRPKAADLPTPPYAMARPSPTRTSHNINHFHATFSPHRPGRAILTPSRFRIHRLRCRRGGIGAFGKPVTQGETKGVVEWPCLRKCWRAGAKVGLPIPRPSAHKGRRLAGREPDRVLRNGAGCCGRQVRGGPPGVDQDGL